MTEFDFLSNVEYKFTDGLTKNGKHHFSRPMIETPQVNKV